MVQAHRHDQDLLDKHARAINEWKHTHDLQQDIEGQGVQLVRDTEDAMYKCRGMPTHAMAILQKEERYWSNWTGVNDPKYDDPNFVDCNEAHVDMYSKRDDPDSLIRGLPRPNCQAPKCCGRWRMLTRLEAQTEPLSPVPSGTHDSALSFVQNDVCPALLSSVLFLTHVPVCARGLLAYVVALMNWPVGPCCRCDELASWPMLSV